MGRAGGGGHSGGHSVSHHSSGGHSTSGHHVGGGSGRRAGSSGGFSSGGRRSGGGPGGGFGFGGGPGGGFGFGGGGPRRRPPRGGPGMPPPGGRGPYRPFGCGCLGSVFSGIVTLTVIIVLMSVVFTSRSASGTATNTKNRDKADTGVAFQNDCIVDDLGWFDNISDTESQLQYFYEKTGVQPYIVLKSYDADLSTDTEKDDYAEQWYVDNIDNEGTLLFMYFAEEDTDNDVGYMTLVNGKQISSVMDSEAIEIFWNYIDNQWYSDATTDDMFVTVFTKTADTIMTKSTTRMDILKYVVIGVIVIGAGVIVLVIMKRRRQYEAEKAAETERILKTPLSGSDDDLVDKYTK